jgi:ammonium transporter, Amt family
MDIVAVHGLAGSIGLVLNGFFGANYINALNGEAIGDLAIPGGWFNHHWVQLPIQLAYIAATSCYAFVVTAIILVVMNYIPGLQLRASQEDEIKGIDEAELGEFIYDFVEVRRDFDSWGTPPDTQVIMGQVREEIQKQHEEFVKGYSRAPSIMNESEVGTASNSEEDVIEELKVSVSEKKAD